MGTVEFILIWSTMKTASRLQSGHTIGTVESICILIGHTMRIVKFIRIGRTMRTVKLIQIGRTMGTAEYSYWDVP